jgi:hypothetical protein
MANFLWVSYLLTDLTGGLEDSGCSSQRIVARIASGMKRNSVDGSSNSKPSPAGGLQQ